MNRLAWGVVGGGGCGGDGDDGGCVQLRNVKSEVLWRLGIYVLVGKLHIYPISEICKIMMLNWNIGGEDIRMDEVI